MEPKDNPRIHAIIARGQQLPFASMGAMIFGSHPAAAYFEQHTGESNGLDDDGAGILAGARLDWLIRATRPELNGLFDEDDFLVMMDSLGAHMLVNEVFPEFLGMVCDDWWVTSDEHEEVADSPPEDFPGLGVLLVKLNALTPMQSLALGDALEQAWHRGYANNMMPREFLATIGIELRDPSPMD